MRLAFSTNASFRVGHGFVLKHADDMNKRIYRAYRRERHVLSLSPDKSLNIDEFDSRVGCLFRLELRRKKVQPRIRNLHNADVRLEPSACCRRGLPLCKNVEDRGLAYRRQADYSRFHNAIF